MKDDICRGIMKIEIAAAAVGCMFVGRVDDGGNECGFGCGCGCVKEVGVLGK